MVRLFGRTSNLLARHDIQVRFCPEDTQLLIVDIQPKFMAGIEDGERVVLRSQFLARMANLLAIPVLASEQNVDRMGATDPRLVPLIDANFAKMAFSCVGCPPLVDAMKTRNRAKVVLVGIETHICVTQTALDLQDLGYEVSVCPDAVGARSTDRHKLGMERMRDLGVAPIHTEALAYEWLKTAEHPKFREALALVKEFA